MIFDTHALLVFLGAVTDWMKLKLGVMKKGHPRNVLLIPLLTLLIIFVGVLCNYVKDMTDQYYLVISSAFAIGFAVYSLISIVGVTVVEVSAPDISGKSKFNFISLQSSSPQVFFLRILMF